MLFDFESLHLLQPCIKSINFPRDEEENEQNMLIFVLGCSTPLNGFIFLFFFLSFSPVQFHKWYQSHHVLLPNILFCSCYESFQPLCSYQEQKNSRRPRILSLIFLRENIWIIILIVINGTDKVNFDTN